MALKLKFQSVFFLVLVATSGAGAVEIETRKTAVEHNQQLAELQAGWPREKIEWLAGTPVEFPADTEDERYKRNHLYLARFIDKKISREPMPAGSWFVHRAERLNDETLRLRHRIDRRKLPPERTYVMWSWRLTEEEAESPVTIKGAAGSWVWQKDALAGYSIDPWIAPEEFRIGETVFRPNGPLWFGKLPGRPEILISSVLRQMRSGRFKDIGEDTLTFEESCPGEDPICEFAIDIMPAIAAGTQ